MTLRAHRSATWRARRAKNIHPRTTSPQKKTTSLSEDTQPAVWAVHACKSMPCYSLTITLPKNAQWSKAMTGPAYAIIPVPGRASDPNHIIRVYGADLLNTSTVEQGQRLFLQEWFSRPYYFGQASRFESDEPVSIDGNPAVITHFSVGGKVVPYRGLGLVAGTPAGTFGFACVFRDDDSGDATSVCEETLGSGRISVMGETKGISLPKSDDDDCGCADDDTPN
jgi:hypothetical protein